jgi:hypothetical protein
MAPGRREWTLAQRWTLAPATGHGDSGYLHRPATSCSDFLRPPVGGRECQRAVDRI